MEFRPIVIKDYSKLKLFWEENNVFTSVDHYENIKHFLKMSKNLSILAFEDNEIIGTVLALYDGRRGHIQKVVVSSKHRNIGIGQKLVKMAIKNLRNAGALDIRLNCEKDLVSFYKKCGFYEDDKTVMRIKDF